ncbi:hypothetical protein F4560_000781 [Saccharothrix ecbatanensis]|uniref:Uncharacterized protein n=1 Tax=Saccharothrix ecbatanensis TaxID=1105145 RepID=A0A7W9LYT9_9PSEU|nr:hypothetical protein [Saccharothrix ecbatanensis]MBB5801013.1 hypothetical protein [Saccharothrix ecbatanensis]
MAVLDDLRQRLARRAHATTREHAANELVKKDDPVEGVQKLIDCPDLASAGQAAAGITATWTWSQGDLQTTVTQYNAVYRGIAGKDVIKQARAAASCHRGSGSGISPLDLDEYFYGGGDLGFAKPFVDRT